MKLYNYLITILVIGVVVSGIIVYINSLGSQYGTEADLSGLNKTMYYMEETQDDITDASNTITSIDLDFSFANLFNVPYKMIQGSWQVITATFKSFLSLGSMVDEVGTEIDETTGTNVMGTLGNVVVSIIVLLGVFMLIYGIWKWKFET